MKKLRPGAGPELLSSTTYWSSYFNELLTVYFSLRLVPSPLTIAIIASAMQADFLGANREHVVGHRERKSPAKALARVEDNAKTEPRPRQHPQPTRARFHPAAHKGMTRCRSVCRRR